MTPLYRIRHSKRKHYLHWFHFSLDWKWNVRDEHRWLLEQTDCIIERCTWMQEINWNRMYEWDIVTFWLDYKDIKYTLIYEWMQWKISDWANLKFVTDWKDLEVIGNIHNI